MTQLSLKFVETVKDNLYSVKEIDGNHFEVSKRGGNTYIVQIKPMHCNCPSFRFHPGRCKHIDLIKPKISKTNKREIPVEEAEKAAKEFISKIRLFCKRSYVGGSIARKRLVVGDIDIAVVPSDLERLKKRCQTLGAVKAQGDKLTNMVYGNIQVNLFTGSYKTWEPLCLYVTGSGEFNQKMRIAAKKKGLLLNQEGLWSRDKEKLISNKEKGIFNRLGMKWVKPEERR